jgi:hypothetical protein
LGYSLLPKDEAVGLKNLIFADEMHHLIDETQNFCKIVRKTLVYSALYAKFTSQI